MYDNGDVRYQFFIYYNVIIVNFLYMQQKMQKNADLATDNTDNCSIVQKQDIGDQPFINKIIESTEQIINSQAIKIFELNNQIKLLKTENQLLRNKYQILLKNCGIQSAGHNNSLTQKINQLEEQLVSTKTELALKKAENLELKFAGMKSRKNIPIPQPQQIIGFPEMDKLRANLISKIEQFDQSLNSSQWNKIIENCLSGYPKIDKFKDKTFDLVKKGIPNQLRSSLWPLTFENKLGITDTLYTELLKRKERDEDYSKRVLSQINKDICRSFNGKTQFESKIGLATQVTEVLQVFHIFRPDVSYVQGMTYPAIVLNLIVGKYKAFNIFCNLILGNQFFRRLYTFQECYLSSYCRAFELLLEERNEKISKALQQRNVQSEIYLVQWFYTFFSRGLSYQFTLKIWDLLAYQEQLLFFKLGLSIFQLLEPFIIQSETEQTITIIRQFSNYITQSKLQQALFAQKLTQEKMQKAIQKVFKKLPKQQ